MTKMRTTGIVAEGLASGLREPAPVQGERLLHEGLALSDRKVCQGASKQRTGQEPAPDRRANDRYEADGSFPRPNHVPATGRHVPGRVEIAAYPIRRNHLAPKTRSTRAEDTRQP